MAFWIELGLFGVVSVLLVAWPRKIVSLHASQYLKHYPTPAELATLDKMQDWNPLSKYMIGRMSDYAREAPEYPERFPRMLAFVRVVGLALMLPTCAAALAVVTK